MPFDYEQTWRQRPENESKSVPIFLCHRRSCFHFLLRSRLFFDEKPALEVDVVTDVDVGTDNNDVDNNDDVNNAKRLSNFLLSNKKLLFFTFQEQKTFLLRFLLLVSRFFCFSSSSCSSAAADISFTFIRSTKVNKARVCPCRIAERRKVSVKLVKLCLLSTARSALRIPSAKFKFLS